MKIQGLILPDILKDEAARKEFLKTDISHAITKLNTATSKDNVDLKSVPYGDLCNALILKLRNMPYEEIKRLRKGDFIMWKMLLVFMMPLLTPFEIAYGLAMKVLMPLGVPDVLGIMKTED